MDEVTNLKRGDICVIREVYGKPEVLRLADQWTYKEWAGCFFFPRSANKVTNP